MRVDFLCPHGEDQVLKKTCPFKFTVFTTCAKFVKGTGEELDGSKDLGTSYSTRFPETWHDYPASSEIMKRTIPSTILKEDIAMKHNSLVTTEVVVGHLEDNTASS